MKTKGNIDLAQVKIGDIHYEFDLGMCIKSEVISLPVRNNEGQWAWQSKALKTGEIIDYMITEEFAHYGPKLYDYEAYTGYDMV